MTPMFRFADRPITLVGVVNTTPDSFSDGGLYADTAAAIRHGHLLVADGADLIDVGGESTRPGAVDVDAAEQIRRVVPVIAALAADGIPVSVDARHPHVVEAALAAGAAVVNDIGGLRRGDMIELIAAAGVPAIAMHMPSADLAETHAHRSTVPIVAEVAEFLGAARDRARDGGVVEVVLDPGLGFGKSVDENVALIRDLPRMVPDSQVMVGASRKRFVGALSGVDFAADRDEASVVVHLAAIAYGARVVRAHDVARHRRAIDMWKQLHL